MRAKEPRCAPSGIGRGITMELCVYIYIYRVRCTGRAHHGVLPVIIICFVGLSALLAASSSSWRIARGGSVRPSA